MTAIGSINAGVYLITCGQTKSAYIGESGNLTRRKRNHLNPNQPHDNPQLCQDMVQYGIASFVFTVLEYLQDKQDRLAAEKKWFDCYSAQGYVMYNLKAGGGKKFFLSNLARQNMATAQQGKQHTPQTKLKISQALTGKPRKPSAVRKTAKAHRGKTVSAETRQKMSEAHKGKTHSPEAKTKMSEAKTGNQYKKGKIPSRESRQLMSESAKARRARIQEGPSA